MPSTIKNIITLAQSHYLNLYDVVYNNKNNRQKIWTVASRKGKDAFEQRLMKKTQATASDAVIIAAYHVEVKKMVLIKQFRVPINGCVYELPAGLLESQEHMLECVSRELKEETGLDLLDIHPENTFVNVYASAGMTDETMDIVYCTCRGEVSSDYLEEDEDIEVVMLDADEAKALLMSQPTIDVKALLALKHYVLGGEAIFKKQK